MNHRTPRRMLAALALVACVGAAAGAGADAAPGAELHAPGIAWRHASTDADIDAAFAQARTESKPVFVYWGAAWCPPCNQVKATLFNRQEFIERSRGFVPVYVDGDSPGAQKIGARFKVSGYPTMVLFNPLGVEMTRLPGEVDPVRYIQVLTLGMNAQRPVKDVLALARAGGGGLSGNDWRLLAFYAWDTDEQQLVPKAELPAMLERLADVCPPAPAEVATRLRLEAIAAAPGVPAAPAAPRTQAMLLALLADPAAAREQMDVLTNAAPEIVRAATAGGSPQRRELLAAFDRALKRLERDASLSRADRLDALIAQVDLATLDAPKRATATPGRPRLPAPLLDDIRAQAASADRETTDGYERQAVITTAAYLLTHAGLDRESDALLTSSLGRSHSPYYLMSELASNAKARGDKLGALQWYQRAYEASEGPATRMQWGASYVGALVELAPQDEARIEAAASALFAEARGQSDALYERSGRALQRVGAKLAAWGHGGRHEAAMGRLRLKLEALCAGVAEAKESACRSLLEPAAGKPA